MPTITTTTTTTTITICKSTAVSCLIFQIRGIGTIIT
jgi:hypothetical protein